MVTSLTLLRSGSEVLHEKSATVLQWEFKVEAVRQLLAGKRPLALVARELGLGPDVLRRWRDELKAGYYARRERPQGARAAANAQLALVIRELHTESDRTYGSPRMQVELEGLGHPCSEDRVARLMRADGLRPKRTRRFRVTTDSTHASSLAPNALAREFAVTTIPRPNQVWSSDITYIATREGWLYLAIVLDLRSRRVVGWATSAKFENASTNPPPPTSRAKSSRGAITEPIADASRTAASRPCQSNRSNMPPLPRGWSVWAMPYLVPAPAAQLVSPGKCCSASISMPSTSVLPSDHAIVSAGRERALGGC
jgi:transposase-like protein